MSLCVFTGLVTAEEVRPLLNAHFLSARVMSKVLPMPDAPQHKRAHGTVAALERYKWLVTFAPALCTKKGVSLEDMFSEELQICKEMSSLLPAKIDKIHFLGEFNVL